MPRGPSYGELVRKHIALQAEMAAWPLEDGRRHTARAELTAMEHRMAVLATHALSCPCCNEFQEMGVVLYGNFRR